MVCPNAINLKDNSVRVLLAIAARQECEVDIDEEFLEFARDLGNLCDKSLIPCTVPESLKNCNINHKASKVIDGTEQVIFTINDGSQLYSADFHDYDASWGWDGIFDHVHIRTVEKKKKTITVYE